MGALLGLFGQAAAYAAGPQLSNMPMTTGQMDADCMKMMQEQQPVPAQKPCKGLTLDCIAAMGCVVPIVLKEPAGPVSAPELVSAPAFWPATAVLIDNNHPPEQHPPTILG